MTATGSTVHEPADLTRFAWLSIVAALVTIGLKTMAWQVTDSVGLLSDAAESVVNLVAAIAALVALRVATKPADDNHNFGHAKAEYFSAAIEGVMIFVAAAVILYTSVLRFLDPRPLDELGVGMGLSLLASLVNGGVAVILLRVGRSHRSPTLVADGKHLMTDVWTSAGVLIGVGVVWVTGYNRLDAVVAFLVGLNIILTGSRLVISSTQGLMDHSLDTAVNEEIAAMVASFQSADVTIHGLRTRQAGRTQFADMHVLVPGSWSVRQGHDLVEDIETRLRAAFQGLDVMCHLEPREDPRSWGDFRSEIAVPAWAPRSTPHE